MLQPPITPLPAEATQKLSQKMLELERQAKETEISQKARALGLPYLDLQGFPISQEALMLVPEQTARTLQVVGFFYAGNTFRIGAVEPGRPEVQELLYQITERTHAQGTLTMISKESLKLALALYSKLPKYHPPVQGVSLTAAELQKFQQEFHAFVEIEQRLQGASATDMVALLIAAALQAQATDLHLETAADFFTVRFRLDGVLQPVAKLPKTDWPKLNARLKLLSGLKLNVTDRPQDGRFTISTPADKIEVRVSTLPSAFGESLVLRLLRSSSTGLDFTALGLRGSAFQDLAKQIARPNGLILVTGPTGSGKTTTLYAILNKLNNPETKIITLEDPIEYKLTGIIQSQIDPTKDYTFAAGLRALLRQDPEVVMVGEIRDQETTEITIQAALTGHLVLSTVHTNSASGALPRLLALGAKPFLLAPAINAIVAQRLVRKIHDACKEEIKLEESALARVQAILSTVPKRETETVPRNLENLKFYRGRGCPDCLRLGYKGRIGIYEVLIMNKEIEEVILSGKISEYTLQEIAVRFGMVTLVQDGLLKSLDGITTVEEIFSVAE